MLNKKFVTQHEMQIFLKTWPAMIYQKNREYCYVAVNDAVQEFCCCPSKETFIGHRDADLSWYDLADRFCSQDFNVLQGNTHIDMEFITVYNQMKKVVLTQKIPIVDTSKQIIGVGVFTVPIGEKQLLSLPQFLFGDLYSQNSLRNKNKNKIFEYGDVCFTRREAQCLSLLLRGATMAEIAKKILRSQRTVESYFNVIREKLGSTKRSFIFEKAVQYGFIDLMFMVIE